MTITNPLTEVEMTISYRTIPVEDDREGTALHPVRYRPWRLIDRIECPTIDANGEINGTTILNRPDTMSLFGWLWVERVETDASEGMCETQMENG